ncbi:MAG TPA: conjugal transfer protein [Euzebyales bacterium]|nr:conjugal transfer protein [Euzebyales bacterium]
MTMRNGPDVDDAAAGGERASEGGVDLVELEPERADPAVEVEAVGLAAGDVREFDDDRLDVEAPDDGVAGDFDARDWDDEWDDDGRPRDRRQFLVGSVLLMRLATSLLWLLVVGALLIGLLALAASLQRVEEQAPASAPGDEGDDAAGAVQAAGFAQLAVRRYIGEVGEGGEEIVGGLLAGTTPELHGVTPAGFFVNDAVTVHVDDRGDGYWAATVAADLMAAVDGEYQPVGIRYYSVGVMVDEHGGARLADVPSQVPAPEATEAADLLAGGLDTPDRNAPQTIAVREFLGALLLGEGSIQRYTAPGTEIAAITPAPFVALEVDGVAIAEPEAERTVVRAAVLAIDGNGLAQRLHYTVDLQLRDGRWEVVELFAAPPLDDDEDRSSGEGDG